MTTKVDELAKTSMSSNNDSLKKSQSSCSCHFCDKQAIHWRCEVCDVSMCTSCKEKIHHRLKIAQDHEIVSIFDICKDNPARRVVASEIILTVINCYTMAVPVVSFLLCCGDLLYFIYYKADQKTCY